MARTFTDFALALRPAVANQRTSTSGIGDANVVNDVALEILAVEGADDRHLARDVIIGARAAVGREARAP